MLKKVLEKFEKVEESDEVLYLTAEEEYAILAALGVEDFLNNGSSRIVFKLNGKYAVKIALDESGRLQNNVELDFFCRHCKSGRFAKLYATGSLVNVMELVEVYESDCWTGFEGAEADAIEEINELTDYYGADNEQIGWSKFYDCIVAYDYGYSTDYSNQELVGGMITYTCCLETSELLKIAKECVFNGSFLCKGDLHEMCCENDDDAYEECSGDYDTIEEDYDTIDEDYDIIEEDYDIIEEDYENKAD